MTNDVGTRRDFLNRAGQILLAPAAISLLSNTAGATTSCAQHQEEDITDDQPDEFRVMRHMALCQIWQTLFWHLVYVVENTGFRYLMLSGHVLIYYTNPANGVRSCFKTASLSEWDPRRADTGVYKNQAFYRPDQILMELGFYLVTLKEGCMDHLPRLMVMAASNAGFNGAVWTIYAVGENKLGLDSVESIPRSRNIPDRWIEDGCFKDIPLFDVEESVRRGDYGYGLPSFNPSGIP